MSEKLLYSILIANDGRNGTMPIYEKIPGGGLLETFRFPNQMTRILLGRSLGGLKGQIISDRASDNSSWITIQNPLNLLLDIRIYDNNERLIRFKTDINTVKPFNIQNFPIAFRVPYISLDYADTFWNQPPLIKVPWYGESGDLATYSGIHIAVYEPENPRPFTVSGMPSPQTAPLKKQYKLVYTGSGDYVDIYEGSTKKDSWYMTNRDFIAEEYYQTSEPIGLDISKTSQMNIFSDGLFERISSLAVESDVDNEGTIEIRFESLTGQYPPESKFSGHFIGNYIKITPLIENEAMLAYSGYNGGGEISLWDLSAGYPERELYINDSNVNQSNSFFTVCWTHANGIIGRKTRRFEYAIEIY